jgi:alpha-galactosidase
MRESQVRIALVGAGGMSFGPVMSYDVIRSEKLCGSTLVLVDIAEDRLEQAYAVANRLNDEMGNPIYIEKESDTARGVAGADFVIVSTEIDRWKYWKMDYEIPVKHGSTQVMGENGGPGGLFHSLRTVKLLLEIGGIVEKESPDAFLINLTNPMSRVTLGLNLGTKVKSVGMCHEFFGGVLHLSSYLLLPKERIEAKASGMNHFTWFYEIKDAKTGEDLYPKVEWHIKTFPFLHTKLIRRCFDEFGLFPTSTDSHIGEYLPFVGEEVHPLMQFNDFFRNEWKMRNFLSEQYGKGRFWLPVKVLPKSGEEVVPIIEGMATKEHAYINAVNVPNKGYVPNLPEGSVVEVPADIMDGELRPQTVPPVHEPLAEIMRVQYGLQDLIVESVLKKDPDIAFKALTADPLSPPSEEKCRKMFNEMLVRQKKLLPF